MKWFECGSEYMEIMAADAIAAIVPLHLSSNSWPGKSIEFGQYPIRHEPWPTSIEGHFGCKRSSTKMKFKAKRKSPKE